MSREVHVRFREHLRGKFPQVTRLIVHCRSLSSSRSLMREVDQRLSECGLTLHPEKTKIVYCRDRSRKADYPVISFDFLGYRFQPRCAQSRQSGSRFLSFLPAVSPKAAKAMGDRIRSWRTHRWTQLTIGELADSFNPTIRGWINYYGRFYKSKLHAVLGQMDYAIVRWAKRKYKRLGGSVRQATAWLKRVVARCPRLFAHWSITHAGLAGR
jgi:RNA-directed DNA polymerase